MRIRDRGRDLRRRAWILVVTQQSDQAKARLSPAQTPWPLNGTRLRVRTSGSPQPSFALGSSEGTAGTDLGRWLTSSDAFVDAWAERSCSQMCSPTPDFADVPACSPVSKSLVAVRIRPLANGAERAVEVLGVKGSQVQILSSRRETAGQRPFRTKPEAASLLPCSHWCSHGTRSHQPIAAESRWTAKRAPWLATWPCPSPVTATKEGPRSSETVCSDTPAASMCVE